MSPRSRSESGSDDVRAFKARGAEAKSEAVNDLARPDDRHCTVIKANGQRCRGWAQKDGSGLCAGCAGKGLAANPKAANRLSHEARRERRRAEEQCNHAVGGPATGKTRRPATGKTPLAALRAILQSDPERYAAGVAAMLERGDPRALGLLERLFGQDRRVEIPNGLSAVDALDFDGLRQLWAELEERGRVPNLLASHLPGDADPASAQG
jgi:hypothetical protein